MSDANDTTDLYVVYLGGELAPGRVGEDHEVVVVAASDIQDARKAAKAKWHGYATPHIDAVKKLSVVDGYRVELHPTNEVDSDAIDSTYVAD